MAASPAAPAILHPPGGTVWFDDPSIVGLVGRKARGLSLLPAAWRPPFFVLTAETHACWAGKVTDARMVLMEAAVAIEAAAKVWRQKWPRGLILRSSADDETLENRGTNQSVRLAADFGTAQVEDALGAMFHSFSGEAASGRLAVVIQPLVGDGSTGHLSNERRVSKTVNQWRWERMSPNLNEGGVNSQRDEVADLCFPLEGVMYFRRGAA